MLVTGSGDDTLKVYDIRNGASPINTLVGHTNCIDTLHCVGDRLVSGSRDSDLKVWDLRSFKCQYTMSVHTVTADSRHSGSVWGLRTDARYCVSVGDDKTVKMWDFGVWHASKNI